MKPTDASMSTNIYLLVSTFVMLMPIFATAQVDTITTANDDQWIEVMNKDVSIKLSVNNDLETYTVDADPVRYELYPNTSTFLRFNFNYRFLAFSINQAPSFLPGNNDEEDKGRTKNFGISLGTIHTHWWGNMSYSRNKGYYLNNSKDFSFWTSGDPYLQDPNLVVNNFEWTLGYNFNKNFSVRSITTQTERQLRSAGSFVPVVGYRLYFVNGLDEARGQKSSNSEITIGAGYHYTLVIKKSFYASLGITPGVGYIFTKLTTRGQLNSSGDLITNTKAPILRIGGRGGIGYNGPKFFAGGLLQLRGSSYEQGTHGKTTAVNTRARTTYQIFVGYRIPAPARLRRFMDKAPVKQ